jgi:hypothetical protein
VTILPADVLDVVVAANGQSQATLHAASFKHDPTIGSRHSLAKTVHSDTPPDFGLISTLGHFTYSE